MRCFPASGCGCLLGGLKAGAGRCVKKPDEVALQEGERGAAAQSADALANLQLGPQPLPYEDREQPEVC